MKPTFPLFYRIFGCINFLAGVFFCYLILQCNDREYSAIPFLAVLSIVVFGTSFSWLLSSQYSRLLLFLNFGVHVILLFIISIWFFFLPEEDRGRNSIIWILYTVLGTIYTLFCLFAAFTKSSLEFQYVQKKRNAGFIITFIAVPLSILIILLYPLFRSWRGLPLFGGAPIAQTEQLENDLEEKGDAESAYISYERPELQTRGQTVASFVPPNFKIDFETEGYLNKDSLIDKVIVIMHLDTTAERASLILLQLPDNTYKLEKVSWKAVMPKYTSDGFETYPYEEVSIDSIGALRFTMQGSGPSGTLESSYLYMDDELVLTHIHTYNMGAGEHTKMEYNLLRSFLEITEINTMDENAPESISTYSPNDLKVLFETADPYEIIISASREL